MHRFANPKRFMSIADRLFPWCVLLSVGFLAAGLYYGLYDSPEDYQQGHTVRIMYIHVPAAYMAVLCYASMAIGSAVFIIWRHHLAEQAARACAPIGMVFTFLCLATGALWGQPMWGTWWVWDARLTSVLIMFFLYMGYMALSNAFDDPGKGARPAAILAIVGAVNLPVIKFSVDWWNTLHQPASLLRLDGPAIDPEMLVPLLCMLAGFKFFFLSVLIIRLRGELLASRLRNMRLTGGGYRS